jgi:hypothetical protein
MLEELLNKVGKEVEVYNSDGVYVGELVQIKSPNMISGFEVLAEGSVPFFLDDVDYVAYIDGDFCIMLK